jgi:hypothetical protein
MPLVHARLRAARANAQIINNFLLNHTHARMLFVTRASVARIFIAMLVAVSRRRRLAVIQFLTCEKGESIP